jgi:hypothetical protein
LTGDYYIGKNFETFALTRVDAGIDFTWFGAPAAGVPTDHFSVRWTGQVIPQFTQTYTFITSADDGVRLWVNGQLLVDNWQDQGVTERQGTIELTAGVPAEIRLEFYDFEWGAIVKLEWQSAGQPRQVIPAARLSAGNGRPAPTLSTPNGSVNGPFTVAVNFGESVTGLATSDFAVSNGAATGLTGSGATYSLTVTPNITGPVTVNLPANGCIDVDGQGNTASNTLAVTYSPPAGTPLQGLSGDYYTGMNFERFVVTRVDQTVNFTWPFEGPTPAMPRDLFSVRWTGKVTPLYSQAYTFITTSDDGVRLWVNNQLLINQWVDQGTTQHQGTIALTAGVPVDIRLEYYENSWGATIRLEWQSASQAREIIAKEQLATSSSRPVPTLATGSASVNGPFNVAVTFAENVSGLAASDFVIANGLAGALTGGGAAYTLTVNPAANGEVTVNLPAGACVDATNESNTAANTLGVTYTPLPGSDVAGLTGEYFSGRNFETSVLSRIEESVNFTWYGPPAAGVPADAFSVRWTGKVNPLYTETYTFITSTDDGVRLWVNNQLLINQWVDQGTTSYQATVALTAGTPVDIRMEFYDNAWGAVARLEWQSASQARQIIPRDRLSTPAPNPPPPAPNLTQARRLISGAAVSGPTTTSGGTARATANASTPTVSRSSVRRAAAAGGTTVGRSSGLEAGLHAEYFSGENFNLLVTARTDDNIAFYWADGAGPLPGVGQDRYSVRWTGRIRPMFSEDYTFFLVSDEGVRLWLNDELIVDRWAPGTHIDFEAPGIPVFLRAGQFYGLRVEFQNVAGDGWVELKWESESQPREIVPAWRFYQPAETAPRAP